MPQPIVFDLDTVGEDAEYPPFEFKHQKKRYSIPNLFTLSPAQMEQFDESSGLDGLQAVFHEIGVGDVGDLLNDLPANKGFALMKAWREHSRETMEAALNVGDPDEGKGSASSTSSRPNRAARRSKRT